MKDVLLYLYIKHESKCSFLSGHLKIPSAIVTSQKLQVRLHSHIIPLKYSTPINKNTSLTTHLHLLVNQRPHRPTSYVKVINSQSHPLRRRHNSTFWTIFVGRFFAAIWRCVFWTPGEFVETK